MLNYNTLATDLLWVCDFVYHRHSVSNTLADVNSSRSHSFRVCTIGYIYKIQFPWSFSDTLLLFYIKSETLKIKAPSPNPLMQKLCNIINIVKSLTLSDFWVIWKLYWVKGFLCAVVWKPEKYFIKNTF